LDAVIRAKGEKIQEMTGKNSWANATIKLRKW
jgi:hypothetical protein